tara:strand:+ start:38 stop:448 length:411 start_codon:yes stop_codon:yes gene_type:complete
MLDKLVVVKRDKFTVLPHFEGRNLKGSYTVVTKCRAGYPTVSIVEAESPYEVFRRYQTGAIMNISFNVTEHDNITYSITVYARVGKKVWASEALLREITVGDINDGPTMSNTSLYSQEQYQAVNAKSWASKAYVMN